MLVFIKQLVRFHHILWVTVCTFCIVVLQFFLQSSVLLWVDVPETRKIKLNEQAQEMYLACAFISQADPKRYGRLKEELENDYTKGTDSYQALTNIAQGMWPDTKDVLWVDVPDPRKIELNEQSHEMYLACAFISQADPKRYGRLKENWRTTIQKVQTVTHKIW